MVTLNLFFMNRINCFKVLILMILSHLLFIACKTEMKELSYETKIQDYNQLVKLFEDPPAEFRSAPLWVWHGIITKEKIDLKLSEFKDKGFGGLSKTEA